MAKAAVLVRLELIKSDQAVLVPREHSYTGHQLVDGHARMRVETRRERKRPGSVTEMAVMPSGA